MTNWNRAYLDALEVPVWVPLNDQEPENTKSLDANNEAAAATAEAKESVTSQSLSNDTATTLVLLEGQVNADFIFVVPHDAELTQCRAALKQFEFAWRTWLEQPFSAAIAQLSAQSDEGHSIEALGGKLIACGQDLSSQDVPSIPAPHLNLSQASKKDWWSLLQRLS